MCSFTDWVFCSHGGTIYLKEMRNSCIVFFTKKKRTTIMAFRVFLIQGS